MANIFLSHHEENWLNKCPMKLEPRFCRGYVDDVFVLFESSESAYSFHKNGKFVTSVYIKPTFTGVYIKYDSFIPTYQKRGPLHTLLYSSFSICCDFKTFHFELDHSKIILRKNNYFLNFMDPWFFHRFLINYIHLKL